MSESTLLEQPKEWEFCLLQKWYWFSIMSYICIIINGADEGRGGAPVKEDIPLIIASQRLCSYNTLKSVVNLASPFVHAKIVSSKFT